MCNIPKVQPLGLPYFPFPNIPLRGQGIVRETLCSLPPGCERVALLMVLCPWDRFYKV
jgi:hypothetical protein